MPARTARTRKRPTAASTPTGEALPMRFVDFAIRAWREGPYLQVLAHSTPAGGMRQPAATRIGVFAAQDYRLPIDASLSAGAQLGRQLARLLFPTEVWGLLGESLRLVGSRPDLGVRLRLCLDDELIDLPWEFLYRRDVDAPAAHSGFLLADGRISLVREPASVLATQVPSDVAQRGLFVGVVFDDGSDGWSVRAEYESLSKSLRPVSSLLSLDFVRADETKIVEARLDAGCSVLHYAGHVDLEAERGALVQLARADVLTGRRQWGDLPSLEALPERARWAWSEALAPKLARGGTRLAVFNACNSGFWPFVRPFMRAGLPALIGVQGLVSNIAALNFAEKLYSSLAVGLSLDEALSYARLYVMDPERAYYDCDWGRFMTYMPTDASVPFPRSERSAIRRRQQQTRAAREQAAQHMQAVAERLDGAAVSRVLSDIAQRSVLILGRFTDERKPVLDAIRTAISTPPHAYVPILFDFDKPGERDLIESIVRFAAVSRFVIADLSDPKSVPAELQAIVPQFPSLPVVPIIEDSQREYPVSDHILRRPSVVEPVRYKNFSDLQRILDERVLAPAEALYEVLKPGALAQA